MTFVHSWCTVRLNPGDLKAVQSAVALAPKVGVSDAEIVQREREERPPADRRTNPP
jgi:hypothetical protein